MNRYEVIRRGVMTGRHAGTTVWQVMDNETRHPSMVKYRPGSLPTWVASFADEAQAYRELMRLEDARARKLKANEQEVLSMHVNSCNELRAERDKLQTEATEARELAAYYKMRFEVTSDPTYERERDELRAEVAKLKAAAKSNPCAPEVTGYAGSFGRLVSAIKRTLYLETAAGIASTVHAASSGREHIISIVLTG